MNARLDKPIPLDIKFSAPIGVDVKGSVWSAIQIPNSVEKLGSLRSVRIDAIVDDVPVEKIKDFQFKLSDYLGSRKTALMDTIRKEKALSDPLIADLKAAITEFKQTYR